MNIQLMKNGRNLNKLLQPTINRQIQTINPPRHQLHKAKTLNIMQ